MKKQGFTLLIILVLAAMYLTGCTNEQSPQNQLNNLDYSNTDYGFGLNPPEGWVKDESNPDIIVGFSGPLIENFTINMVITAGKLDTGKTLYTTVNELIELYPTYFSDFLLIARENRTINNLNSYQFIYSYVLEDIPIKQKQVLIEKDDKAIILTLSATPNSFDTYKEVFEESIQSVKISW